MNPHARGRVPYHEFSFGGAVERYRTACPAPPWDAYVGAYLTPGDSVTVWKTGRGGVYARVRKGDVTRREGEVGRPGVYLGTWWGRAAARARGGEER